MKLQLALDVFNLEDALSLTWQVRDYIDIIEIGTPFIMESGMNAVRRFRETFPKKEILADTKIMDAGELEAGSAFRAGADYVTVLGVTDFATIKACVAASKRCGKIVCADMICVDDLPRKISELEELGVQGIAVHTGVDQQKKGRTPLDDLRIMKKYAKRAEISVAGGIKYQTVSMYAELKPDVLIVGGAIAEAADPVAEAKRIYERIQSFTYEPG